MKNPIKFLKVDKRPGHGGKGEYTKSGFLLRGYLLPNVDMFRVLDAETDKILAEIGILRNLITNYLYKEHSNGPANMYIRKNLDYLHKLAQEGDEEKFVKHTKKLELRSKALMSVALFKTEPYWYRSYPAETVIHWLKDYWARISGEYPRIALTYRRVWIPKPDGTKRPLSVPRVPWRMILVLKYLWIKVWLSGKKVKLPCQYGVGTNLGLRKAWDAIMERVSRPTIFEFDLEKFYDNIFWGKYYAEITALGIPYGLRLWMSTAIQHSQIEQGMKKTEEDSIRLNNVPTLKECITTFGKFVGIIEYMSRRISRNLDRKALAWRKENVKTLKMPNGLHYTIRSNSIGDRDQRGLPQGLTLAGFAACAGLKAAYEELEDDLIMYIDDGVIMMKESDPLKIIKFQGLLDSAGIAISPKKSGYVKYNGVWQKPLKFLGMVYDGRTGRIKASTRKGSNMELPDLEKLKEKLESMGYHNIRGDTMTNWWLANRLNLTDFLLAYIFNRGRLIQRGDGGTLEKNKRENEESFLSRTTRIREDLTRENCTSYMVPLLRRLHEKRRLWEITFKDRKGFEQWLQQIAHDKSLS